jgi:hypothetical protein
VLDLVPLARAGRDVADVDRETDLVGDSLELLATPSFGIAAADRKGADAAILFIATLGGPHKRASVAPWRDNLPQLTYRLHGLTSLPVARWLGGAMGSRMVLAAAALAFGCRSPTQQSVDLAKSRPAPEALSLTQGLTKDQIETFYHLAEGSELIPLTWFRALERADSETPFAQALERYGLIPDPDSPKHLPIGLTAAPSFDLALVGDMVGINCAACHVGTMRDAQGNLMAPLLGAPNLFDIEGFFTELARAVKATAISAPKLVRFVRALREADESQVDALNDDDIRSLIRDSSALMQKRDERPAHGEKPPIDERIERLVKEENRRPVDDLRVGFTARKRSPLVDDTSNSTSVIRLAPDDKLSRYLQSPEAEPRGFKAILPNKRVRVMGDYLSVLVRQIRVLRARAAFIVRLGNQEPKVPPPGFGRVDAFGSARNLMFDSLPPRAKSAPVSYPYLWGIGFLRWLHWDGNTNSMMERDLGQAIGLGAIVEPRHLDSTLLPANIARLEAIAQNIQPPVWPFGPIDNAKAAAGKKLFADNCLMCHPMAGESPSPKLALEFIRTDPLRAVSVAEKINGVTFYAALGERLSAIKQHAYEVAEITAAQAADLEKGHLPTIWRLTGQYEGRPLVAIWATAPYLHNGSVPTISDLLLPPSSRPVTFKLGRTYDPVRLGYVAGDSDVQQTVDTTRPGNSNSGHDYGTGLAPIDREKLIEYLKGQ